MTWWSVLVMVATVFDKTQARARKSIFCFKSYKNVALNHFRLFRSEKKLTDGNPTLFNLYLHILFLKNSESLHIIWIWKSDSCILQCILVLTYPHVRNLFFGKTILTLTKALFRLVSVMWHHVPFRSPCQECGSTLFKMTTPPLNTTPPSLKP